jgi:hypothetical protein
MSLAIPDTSRLTSIVSNKVFSLYFTASSHGYKENNGREAVQKCLFNALLAAKDERVQIDWQLPLSGAYSIMMVNSAQPGEDDRGARPPPFHSIYHHEQSCRAYARALGEDALYFCSTLFCSVVAGLDFP